MKLNDRIKNSLSKTTLELYKLNESNVSISIDLMKNNWNVKKLRPTKQTVKWRSKLY